jgi:radical SAM protein with 4Fe4S-binding SPASM domain
MIDIGFLYCGVQSGSTGHRYGVGTDLHGKAMTAESGQARRPIVAWNITRACNLKCRHCYSNSDCHRADGELTTVEAKKVIDDLADYGVPVVLFSGGEPILRSDLFELIDYARSRRIKTVLSTNGTLIDGSIAERIVGAGVDYVGISLDSADEKVHDGFRGVAGAWRRTMEAIRRLKAVNQKVGLRITLAGATIDGLEAIFDLLERESIDRVCFYHLVPVGRGAKQSMVAPVRVRQGIETILSRTKSLNRTGRKIEVLTVDNHCDGPFVYLKLKEAGDPGADDVNKMLKWNGGAMGSGGVGIACIDWTGTVHPDQFRMDYSVGRVREKRFGEIWDNSDEPMLKKLRNRREYITGRCSKCRFFELCGGSLRARAQNLTGDAWASDPACYLSDEEISSESSI